MTVASVGWLIVMVPMMLLMMGGMIWMMMRGMGGGSGSSAPATESPAEVLERRLAEGEISIEEYRARRAELLDGTAEESGHPDEDALTASRGDADRD